MDLVNFFNYYSYYFSKVKFKKLNTFFFKLGLRGLGLYNYQNFKISGEFNFLRNYLTKIHCPVVFDVGANEGEYAKLCKNINKQTKIFCFRASSKNFSKAKK